MSGIPHFRDAQLIGISFFPLSTGRTKANKGIVQTRMRIHNRTITSPEDFIYNCLLPLISQQRLEYVKRQDAKVELAISLNKKIGPVYLPEEDIYRTAFELLQCGYFQKDTRTGSYELCILYEVYEEYSVEEDDLISEALKSRTAGSSVKPEPEVKKEIKKETKAKKNLNRTTQLGTKKESQVKKEQGTSHKRGISQVSISYDSKSEGEARDREEESELESLTDLLKSPAPYSLRSRT